MFVHPYEKANLESFLEGPVRAFEYFGGVPRRSAYDHLKGAVIYVGQGKNRRRTKRFQERRAWYLFETRFCPIAKGNEKGDVENGGKRSERTYLSPEPRVDSLPPLARPLFDDGRKDRSRPGPQVHGGKTVGKLFEEEKSCRWPSTCSASSASVTSRPA
jgi:transposase